MERRFEFAWGQEIGSKRRLREKLKELERLYTSQLRIIEESITQVIALAECKKEELVQQCKERYERERERLTRAESRLAAEIADFEKEVCFKRRMKPLNLDLEQIERMLSNLRFD